MGLSVYGNTGGFSPPVCELWFESSRQINTMESADPDSLIDHSLPGNRFYTQVDGSIAIIPKSIPEVLGERLLRPALDTTYRLSTSSFKLLKDTFLAVDDILSRALNIIPGVAASEVSVGGVCDPMTHEQFLELVKAVNGDPKGVQALAMMYSQGTSNCSHKLARLRYVEDLKEHATQKRKMDDALKECRKKYPDYKCDVYSSEVVPDVFQIQSTGLWTNSPGSLNWSVYVVNWKTTLETSGGYNYDDKIGKPTSESRKDIEDRNLNAALIIRGE